MKKSYFFLLAVLPIIILPSCGDDDDDVITVVPSSVFMHYGDTQQLTAESATGWTSENDFVATVDQRGLVTGGHIGSTHIVAYNGKVSASASITIAPKYNLYDTPLLLFGASKSVIKSKETHAFDVETETDKLLNYVYTKNGHPCIVSYLFTDGALTTVMVMLSYSDYAQAALYLLERYQPVYEFDGGFAFINSMALTNADLLVYFSTYTYKSGGSTVVTVMYAPYSKKSDVKAQIQRMSQPTHMPMNITSVKL